MIWEGLLTRINVNASVVYRNRQLAWSVHLGYDMSLMMKQCRKVFFTTVFTTGNYNQVKAIIPSHLEILLKVFNKKKYIPYICELIFRPARCIWNAPTAIAEGEKQKSIERPVINSFTVIKTLESLKGVRLPNELWHFFFRGSAYPKLYCHRGGSVHSWARKKKKKKKREEKK